MFEITPDLEDGELGEEGDIGGGGAFRLQRHRPSVTSKNAVRLRKLSQSSEDKLNDRDHDAKAGER